jgi:nicotinamide mononucleotide transporter
VKFNNSEQIFLDTLTTTIGIIAQLMMIFRFKEQWYLWFILDILCVVLWAVDGNWCLSVQYIFWAINCIYGMIIWKK